MNQLVGWFCFVAGVCMLASGAILAGDLFFIAAIIWFLNTD